MTTSCPRYLLGPLDHGHRLLFAGPLLSSTNWEERVDGTGRSSRYWEEYQVLGGEAGDRMDFKSRLGAVMDGSW